MALSLTGFKVSDGRIAYIMHMTETLFPPLFDTFPFFSDIHKLMTVGIGDG